MTITPLMKPAKRFLRAVQAGRVILQLYMHPTKGETWRSLPFGLWFYEEHKRLGFVRPAATSEGWSKAAVTALHSEAGLPIELTPLGVEWLENRA